jgi:hypothetical protein
MEATIAVIMVMAKTNATSRRVMQVPQTMLAKDVLGADSSNTSLVNTPLRNT